MLTIVTSYTRPNVSVPFFVSSSEFAEMLNTYYISTGKLVESSTSITNGGLTAVITAKWRSRAEFASFLEEPLLDALKAARQLHMDTYGITVDQTVDFQPSFGDPGSTPPTTP